MGPVQISALLPLPCISPAAAGIRVCLNPAPGETQGSGECGLSLGLDTGLSRTAGLRPIAVHGDGLELALVSTGLWISSTTASCIPFHK